MSDTTYSGPYARAAQIYRSAGWQGVLPIGRGPGQKYPPPSAFTGHDNPDPSGADVQTWIDGPEGAYNIGLRLPPGVIGLDVDAYPGKRGGEELARLTAQWGPLPATWVTSARTDGISGIRLYRVPLQLDGRDINWPGEAGRHIEIIQHGHRYANVWPSTNPDAGGATYEWSWQFEYEGDLPEDMLVPRPITLPLLPDAWVRGLALAYDRTEKSELASGQLADWWAQLRNGEACPVVHSVLTKAVDALREVDGSRHETARDALAALVRAGGDGHRGVSRAVGILAKAFSDAVGRERVEAGEWHRLLTGAVKLAASDNKTPQQHCEHDAATSLGSAAELVELLERQRRAEHEAAAARYRSRLDECVREIEKRPFGERAAAVRELIPELAEMPATEQSAAIEQFSSKHGMSDLGMTEMRKLLAAAARERKAILEQAARESARAVAVDRVESARREGTLLPPPHAPMDVARALAARLPAAACWWRGDFYRWTGTRYVQWRDEAVDNWLYAQTEGAQFEQSDDKGPAPWRPTENKITGVSHALSRGVLYRPSEDEAEDSPTLVSCTNGVYDVTADALLPHSPERFNLQSVPFAYDPEVKAPLWEWFLNDVLPGDDQAQRFLQEWFGYVISGRTDLEKIADLVGRRRCGKGTVATVLEALVGPENVASPSIPSLVGTFGEQPLIGKSLAVFSDISWACRDITEGVEILKKISGQDTRDVNRKNREVWHGRLGVRFMIMGNDMPRFTDASGALAGRMVHVQFPGSFYGREDPTMKTRLLEELPGILNWALEGLRRLTANGRFTEPQSSEELAAEVRRQQSPVQAFIDDTCAMSEQAHPVALDELFPVYRVWAQRAGIEHPLNREHFSRSLGSAGLSVRRERVNGVRARRVYGVVPQTEPDGRTAWVALLNPVVLPS